MKNHTAVSPLPPSRLFQKFSISNLLGIFLFFSVSSLSSENLAPIPRMESPVVDTIGLLDQNTQMRIISKILNLQKETGSQIQVLILGSTKPETIEEYSIRVAELWKIGRKGVDDGVILLIAKDDRRLRIEVGYGLEGSIPDAIAKRIIDQKITPAFKNGDFALGIESGIDSIIGLIQGEDLPAPNPVQDSEEGSDWGSFSLIIAGIGFLIGLIFRVIGNVLLAFVSLFLFFSIAGIVAGAGILSALLQSLFFTVFALAFLYSKGGAGSGSSGGWSSGGGGGWSGGGGSCGGGGSSGSW
jgi:uncharacterized protein